MHQVEFPCVFVEMMMLMMCDVHRAFLTAKKQLEEKRAQARSLRDQRDVSYSMHTCRII